MKVILSQSILELKKKTVHDYYYPRLTKAAVSYRYGEVMGKEYRFIYW